MLFRFPQEPRGQAVVRSLPVSDLCSNSAPAYEARSAGLCVENPPWLMPRLPRVLGVEGSTSGRVGLVRALADLGYSVDTAFGESEAIDLLRRNAYDILMANVRLNGASGCDMTERLHLMMPDLPIILYTEPGCESVRPGAKLRGAPALITKPFNRRTLSNVLAKALERRNRRRCVSDATDLQVMRDGVAVLAAALEARESSTAEHCRRVADLCAIAARELQLPTSERELLRLAALVHDVGKIGTPDNILNKPGKLDEQEWHAMRLHSAHGAEILTKLEQLSCVADIVRHHHEWMNGEGYPDRLSGDAIPMPVRIIAVADAFEVMTSDRVYRAKLSLHEAMSRLRRGAGTQFDPVVVEAFQASDFARILPAASIDAPVEVDAFQALDFA